MKSGRRARHVSNQVGQDIQGARVLTHTHVCLCGHSGVFNQWHHSLSPTDATLYGSNVAKKLWFAQPLRQTSLFQVSFLQLLLINNSCMIFFHLFSDSMLMYMCVEIQIILSRRCVVRLLFALFCFSPLRHGFQWSLWPLFSLNASRRSAAGDQGWSLWKRTAIDRWINMHLRPKSWNYL